eukprot:CAMPEP_0195513556 /NCGR_PEP_ID=MMETSP0794_2-20130614/5187_1 /TAXON_ID=515487 /ORGANISM="Stephanopyxis turris, Strain CCMP 815" /LENGTH=352 /DNA_ID=CAMNT_0040641603 /DNA_START=184 /DNA_END=1242 /DNA_ORIENTATION=-
MTKHGGLVLTPSIEDDLNVLNKVCRCKEAYLDVFHRELEVLNFTVSLPPGHYNSGRGRDATDGNENPPALRIGRVYLKWDSYLAPCLEIVVEDVDILVEFLNLMLTKTNWNELVDEGFPPTTAMEPSTTINSGNTFVSFGDVNLKGSVTLQLKSRTLNEKLCNDLILDFSTLTDLLQEIRKAGADAEARTGRKGCSTDELYDILGIYFKTKLKKLLKFTALDIGRSALDPNTTESNTARQTKDFLHKAKGVISNYATKSTDVTEEMVRSKMGDQLKKWGLDTTEVTNKIKNVADAAVESMSQKSTVLGHDDGDAKKRRRISEDQMNWIKNTYKSASDAAVASYKAGSPKGET